MDFSEFNKYFLGANSASGFVSCFDLSYNVKNGDTAYIIKGGPGTGKSSLMKYIAAACVKAGKTVELFPCSSDPDSLDGIRILPERTVFLDGTAPHIVEPKHPGICEHIINTGEFWDKKKLASHREEILNIMAENKAYHARASRYIMAAGKLLSDNMSLQKRYVSTDKITAFARHLSAKYIPKKSGKGQTTVRFLSGITPKGVIFFSSTLLKEASRHIIISDKYGSVSSQIMATVLNEAVSKGHDVIEVKNPFFPNEITDHVIIPSLNLAFCTENDYMHINTDERRIHSRRFEHKDFKKNREKLRFNKNAAKEMLLAAGESLYLAKRVHDDLEAYYIKAMDFDALAIFIEKLSKEIINER